jgi:PqqA peptide cyclase
MREPCRSCERREIDWGGCRCQAMAIAGDPAATDPVCVKSPLHGRVVAFAEDVEADDEEFVYRRIGFASPPAMPVISLRSASG